MLWVFRQCLTGIPNDGMPNDGIPNNGMPNDGIPNNGLPSNYIRYNMWWVFCPCLPNDGIPNERNAQRRNTQQWNVI